MADDSASEFRHVMLHLARDCSANNKFSSYLKLKSGRSLHYSLRLRARLTRGGRGPHAQAVNYVFDFLQ